MSLFVNVRKQKRRRHKSSPTDSFQYKKCRSLLESDYDSEQSELSDSVFFDTIDPDIIADKQTMNTKFSEEDTKTLSSLIVSQIKPDLIKELKDHIHSLVSSEVAKQMQPLQSEIKLLKSENETLREDLHRSRLEIDELEQYGRRMCLNIANIPGDTGDASENIEKKLLKEANSKGIALTESDIDKCHRLGKKGAEFNRKVIVKFTNSTARDRVYSARRSMRSDIFVQENLTRFREGLAYEARQLVRSKHLAKTWIAGCKVYAQLPQKGSETPIKVQINDMNTIQCIKDNKPLPVGY